jgi:hypothetical protein
MPNYDGKVGCGDTNQPDLVAASMLRRLTCGRELSCWNRISATFLEFELVTTCAKLCLFHHACVCTDCGSFRHDGRMNKPMHLALKSDSFVFLLANGLRKIYVNFCFFLRSSAAMFQLPLQCERVICFLQFQTIPEIVQKYRVIKTSDDYDTESYK